MELWEVPNASARLCVRKVNGFNELISRCLLRISRLGLFRLFASNGEQPIARFTCVVDIRFVFLCFLCSHKYF